MASLGFYHGRTFVTALPVHEHEAILNEELTASYGEEC